MGNYREGEEIFAKLSLTMSDQQRITQHIRIGLTQIFASQKLLLC
jgi:hypothetical protein